MAIDNGNELPTLDDFTEDSLLDTPVEKESKEDAKETKPLENLDEAEAEEAQRIADEEAEEAIKLEEEEAEKVKLEEEAKLTEEELAEKKEEEKLAAEKKAEEEPEDTFWDDVEKLTGVEVEDVDYGDEDPESPEGAAIREAALVKQVENNVWKYIEDKHPKIYKAIELEAAGGSITDIITPDYVDYAKIEIDPENETQQKKILLEYYMDVKKLSESRAQRMVEADEDEEADDALLQASQEALKERQDTQKTKEDGILTAKKEEAAKQTKQDQQVVGYVKDTITEGKIGSFQLPKAERDKFSDYFLKAVQRNPNGGYMFSVPLGNENFDEMMEQAYFSFKGGELDQLVKRRATTEVTKRVKRSLKRDVKKVETSTSSSAEDKKRASGKKLPTMDIFSE